LRDRRSARARYRDGETTPQENGLALKEFEQREFKSWEAEHSAELAFFRLNWSKNAPCHVVGFEDLLSTPNREKPKTWGALSGVRMMWRAFRRCLNASENLGRAII
jgi:hypothetical protein